jgi:copper transport protein
VMSHLADVSLSGPGRWLTGIERGLLLAGLALPIGGLSGRGLAKNLKGTFPTPLPGPWAMQGCLLGMAAALALTVTALADSSLAAKLAHPLVAGPRSSATLVFAVIELVCFALAALLLRLGKPGPAVQPLLGVVLAESLRAHPEGLLPLAGALLTICHLLPALIWVGMLVYVLRAAVAWRADPVAIQGLIRLYGNAAAWLFSIVVVTGVLSAVLLVPLSSLLTTDYGRFLIAKAALVAVVAGLAVAGRVALSKRAAAGAGPPRVTRLECATLVAVLVVTGLLTVITPPAKQIFGRASPATTHVGHRKQGDDLQSSVRRPRKAVDDGHGSKPQAGLPAAVPGLTSTTPASGSEGDSAPNDGRA